MAKIPFLGMILIDPSMMDSDTWFTHQRELQAMFDLVKKGATARRDSWRTKEEARKYLQTRNPYSTWDERIMKSYIVRHPALPLSPVADGAHRSTACMRPSTRTGSPMYNGNAQRYKRRLSERTSRLPGKQWTTPPTSSTSFQSTWCWALERERCEY